MSEQPSRGRHRAQPARRDGTKSSKDGTKTITPVRTGSRIRRATRVFAALILIPAIAALILWLRQPASAEGSPGAAIPLTGAVAQGALSAARTDVQQILSYDYRNISTDIAQAQHDSTGVFAQQYSSTAKQLLSEAKQERTIVQATVGSAGVVSASPHDVVCLLFVDQATVRQPTGQKSPTTRIDQSRVRLTMTLVGDRWLVSQLAAL